jgi:hypothetical protein
MSSNNNIENDTNFIDFTGSTQQIEDNHISDNTRQSYIRTLIQFMIFLFDKHKETLVNLEELEDAAERDNNKKSRPFFRAECRKQLERMNRIEKNSPIILTGQDAINYRIISQFMNTKNKMVKVDKTLAAKFKRSQAMELDDELTETEDEEDEEQDND